MIENVLEVFVISNRMKVQSWRQLMMENVVIKYCASRHLPCRVLSSITSESFVQKYSFLVKLSRIFDFALKGFSLCVYWKQKHCLRATSKILDNFTKNEYFWAKLSEVVKLMSTATSQSLSTNGQVWSTLRAVLDLNFHFFSFEPRSKNHRFSPKWKFENKFSGRKKIRFFLKHFFSSSLELKVPRKVVSDKKTLRFRF